MHAVLCTSMQCGCASRQCVCWCGADVALGVREMPATVCIVARSSHQQPLAVSHTLSAIALTPTLGMGLEGALTTSLQQLTP
jgi:hypothetical protein